MEHARCRLATFGHLGAGVDVKSSVAHVSLVTKVKVCAVRRKEREGEWTVSQTFLRDEFNLTFL